MQQAATIAVNPSAPSRAGERLRTIARNAFPFVVVGAIWEIVARSGVFPPVLFPTLEKVASTFVRLTVSGILPHHALDTVLSLSREMVTAVCHVLGAEPMAGSSSGKLDQVRYPARPATSAYRPESADIRRIVCRVSPIKNESPL